MKERTLDWSGPKYDESTGMYVRWIESSHPHYDIAEEMWMFDRHYMKRLGLNLTKARATLTTRTREWPGDEPPVPLEMNLSPLPEIITESGDVQLLGPQVEHVKHLVRALRRGRIGVDLSATGVGKTPSALMVAKNLKRDVFVVCPKAVIPSWEKWGERMGVNVQAVNYEKLIRGSTPYVRRMGKRMRPAYRTFKWEVDERAIIVLDEAHRCKGRDTLQGYLCSALNRTKNKILLLSATLAETPMEMKQVGYLLGFHTFTDFYDWIPKMGCVKGRFGWFFPENQSVLRTMRSSIIPSRGHRLTVEDMGEYFPDNHIIAETFDIDARIAEVYRHMQVELNALAKRAKRDRPSEMTILLRAAQEAELLKVPFFVEKAMDLKDEGNSVAIFVQYRETMRAIQSKLGGLEIQGDQNSHERQAAIEAFQNDKNHFIICQMQAGGTGISLHQENDTKRPRATIISPCFDARLFKQVLGRCHRVGSRDPVTQYIAFDASSDIEVKMCKAIERKIRAIDTLNDGDLLNELKIITP